MTQESFLIVILISLVTQLVHGSSLEFYVAVDGSDSWDGTSPVPLDGTNSGIEFLNMYTIITH